MKTKITLFAMLLMSTLVVRAQSIMNIHQSNGTVLQIPLNMIDSITYTISNTGNFATLTTTGITNISSNIATSGGDITDDGGSPVLQRGVVWSINPNPTTADNSTNEGTGTGIFTSNMAGLYPNTTYYVRAYATNSAGIAYGNEISFTTNNGVGGIVSNPGTGVTFDGHTYPTIVLGNGQEWMAENLRTSIFANGDPIPNVSDSTQWIGLSSEAWASQNNTISNETIYGKLYNWYVVVDQRNACPTNWHVPSHQDWTNLFNYLGGENFAGGKMKTTGTQIWWSPNGNATNESGFSALPGGYRNYSDGVFHGVPGDGTWWSSNEGPSSNMWSFSIGYLDGGIYRGWYSHNQNYGFSIRCIKD
jgi:uncharacterized protein (TIGR02145 family)